MMTRRQAIQKTAFATAAVAVGSSLASAQAQTAAGPFILPLLPYSFDALEPHIDAPTMQIHHDRHHAAYVMNLNKAVADQPKLAKKTVEELLKDLASVPETIRTAVRNHGGGHYNHSLFWQMLKSDGASAPKAALAKTIDQSFGSFAGFKDKFTDAATKVFGSGWAWLVLDGKAIKIESSPNQDSPVSQGRPVLLGLDVWEHAYYLKYQNKRADYIAAWFKVINWDFVSERFEKLA